MSYELKIKMLTLGYEARQIRRFEQKLKRMRNSRKRGAHASAAETADNEGDVPGTNPEGYARWGNAKLLSLQAHRRGLVRQEARRTHLARMFLKGTPYKAAEQKTYSPLTMADTLAIQRMAEKYARFAKMDAEGRPGEFRSQQQLAQRFAEWLEAKTEAAN